MPLTHARIAAFGSTRRKGVAVEEDQGLADLLACGAPVATIVGKTWDAQVTRALQTSLEENLTMIGESVRYLKDAGRRVVFDAEHFFDGYKANPDYALSCLRAAHEAGADSIDLCETNGGALPFEVEEIVAAFKSGQEEIWLKRMGRTEDALWYEKVDFREVSVLVIEWTHGNSDCYQGVDIPVLLNSTPQETLAHRAARGRDGGTDSPFTMMVLELEQEKLKKQAKKAKLIVLKQGELLSYEEFCERMGMTQGGDSIEQ